MKARCRRFGGSRLAVLCLVVGLGLAFGYEHVLGAPPRRPRRPVRPKGVAKRPGPVERHRKPLLVGKRPRFARRIRYWHPSYHRRQRVVVWNTLGYPYYLGGKSYTFTEVHTSDSEVQTSDSEVQDETEDRYAQIQILTELIHEWRTLNESPDLHQRLPMESAVEGDQKFLASIKEANEQFDRTSRQAMQKLAAGQSAEDDLESARGHLEKLIALAEVLPESAKPTPQPTAK